MKRFSAFKGEQREDRRSTNRDNRFSKTSNFSASSNMKETKQRQSDHCSLVDDTHKIWSCPLFRNVSAKDRYAAVRKQRLCYGCLGKGHAIKNCQVKACGINECMRKHNRLLNPENQTHEVNHAVNVKAVAINQSNEVTSSLQIIPVSKQSGGNRLNTYAFLDSGSTVYRSQCAREVTSPMHRCDDQHCWHTRNKASEDRKVFSQNKGTTIKGAFNQSVCTPVHLPEKHKLQLQEAEAKLQSLDCFATKSFNLMEVGIILIKMLTSYNAHWTIR